MWNIDWRKEFTAAWKQQMIELETWRQVNHSSKEKGIKECKICMTLQNIHICVTGISEGRQRAAEIQNIRQRNLWKNHSTVFSKSDETY